ncbi:mtN3/saliva family protein [Dictyocaulus viviparus]|uniref:Sugar transporter SWEET n=1 Tax=Dictyocaulus viviparus TaxID=29172 RepID=A0A0D8XUA1_DICVI|nr:mtN3/saliva family protein [Dictyocaulus viviparus]
MELTPLTIFTAWLGIFSISFTLMPLTMVLEWRRRGTADGFSSVNFVLPMLMTSCWLKHGYMTNDNTNITINTINIVFFVLYLAAFAYYQPKRKYLYGQLLACGLIVKLIFMYVEMQSKDVAADAMGSIAAATQIASLAGGVYEIIRAISFGHTEYLPAMFQYAMFALIVQWLAFGLLTGNKYIAVANMAALVVNVATISLYFVYPPITWRVPIIGTGPQRIVKKD